jgi:hypothetical protein
VQLQPSAPRGSMSIEIGCRSILHYVFHPPTRIIDESLHEP